MLGNKDSSWHFTSESGFWPSTKKLSSAFSDSRQSRYLTSGSPLTLSRRCGSTLSLFSVLPDYQCGDGDGSMSAVVGGDKEFMTIMSASIFDSVCVCVCVCV